MSDKEQLDTCLCNIVTNSKFCDTCAFQHCVDVDGVAYCFFALECIANDHKHYKKEEM